MIYPTEDDIGRTVIFKQGWMSEKNWKRGVISSFNDKYVHVKYGNNVKPTDRENLYWNSRDDETIKKFIITNRELKIIIDDASEFGGKQWSDSYYGNEKDDYEKFVLDTVNRLKESQDGYNSKVVRPHIYCPNCGEINQSLVDDPPNLSGLWACDECDTQFLVNFEDDIE